MNVRIFPNNYNQKESHLPLLRLVLNPSLFDRCISISLGIGSVDVNRNDDAIQKGIGREQTAKMKTPEAMIEELEKLAQQLEEDMGESGLAGRCVTLKLKNEDFNLSTRSKTLSHYIWSADDMFNVAQELLCKELEANSNLSLRLIGLRMSTIVKKSELSQNKSIFVVDPSNEEPDSKKPNPTLPKRVTAQFALHQSKCK
ncbi:lesion bypass DNA polymerase [Rhizoclosmatium globosum]|uniref:DNA-directed DNA polymerase n=1 Tax=Rhizoclosmatium globosum TaxID=329046 RepID=A0A1Y2D128_9FUNG|nr:lesion bypass DNA polymerase [Rhizoclosmatium globosum]|eukprot:ORY52917.1 lesion bypass DNA polymerase [Rhizoclosmatium globosum]